MAQKNHELALAAPEAVKRCVRRLQDLDVWHNLSRNAPATGCRDAAHRRVRLGHQGIPLWDELKSYLGQYLNEGGEWRIFLAHCRGDRELDEVKLRQALGTEHVQRLSAEAVEHLGVAYGLINPLFGAGEVVQIFDNELRQPIGVPGTVMTNAGHATWAMELHPAELVLKLPGACWADIVGPGQENEDARWGVRAPKRIGILTGNPGDSGSELMSNIYHHVRQLLGTNSLGDVSMPHILISAAPEIGISMEMDTRTDDLRRALVRGIGELCDAGAKILAHPAHTTSYFAPAMADRAELQGATFMSMVAATVNKLKAMGITELALLGTRFVTDFSLPWSAYRELLQEGMKVHVPDSWGWGKIHQLAYEFQQNGVTPLCFNIMRDLLTRNVPQTCQHVVLAMTEFNPVVRDPSFKIRYGKILVNPLDIYGEAIAREYLGLSLLHKNDES